MLFTPSVLLLLSFVTCTKTLSRTFMDTASPLNYQWLSVKYATEVCTLTYACCAVLNVCSSKLHFSFPLTSFWIIFVLFHSLYFDISMSMPITPQSLSTVRVTFSDRVEYQDFLWMLCHLVRLRIQVVLLDQFHNLVCLHTLKYIAMISTTTTGPTDYYPML